MITEEDMLMRSNAQNGLMMMAIVVPLFLFTWLVHDLIMGVRYYTADMAQVREDVAITWLSQQKDKEYAASVLITYERCREMPSESSDSCLTLIGDSTLHHQIKQAEASLPLPVELARLQSELVARAAVALVRFTIG
ncbi:hypothetical protein D3C87_348070 [compost metagenome]